MASFVDRGSIVRRIWGDRTLVLLIFAGAAAEFAVNRAVDWLFFTGKLPGDPLGRLFATARVAQDIIFGEAAAAEQTLRRIAMVHRAVERHRDQRIPDWAQRDVLYLLIGYSERAYELLHRPLTAAEQRELYEVFRRVGRLLGLVQLPATYAAWQVDRARHLARDLCCGPETAALLAAYRQHLGRWRYRVLLLLDGVLVPPPVRRLLGLESHRWVRAALTLLRRLLRGRPPARLTLILVPRRYRVDLRRLGRPKTAHPLRHAHR